MPLMTYQPAGQWTTPYGPNVRYTVRLHVVGEGLTATGGVWGVDRYAEYRVVTPLGELAAAANAAVWFTQAEPDSIYAEVEITKVEHEFTIGPGDHRSPESHAL
jgi:hypothetical protein